MYKVGVKKQFAFSLTFCAYFPFPDTRTPAVEKGARSHHTQQVAAEDS